MTAYSKAAKRRAKRDFPALAAIRKREKNGRHQRETTTKEGIERDPDATALKARARHMGKTDADFRDMRAQTLGEAAGMALSLSLPPDTAKQLHAHYTALTAARARYHRTLGVSEHPKTAKIEMEPERIETRADDKSDMRTEEQRDRDAKAAWARWCGFLGELTIAQSGAITSAGMGWVTLVDAGSVTPAGQRFVAAMVALGDAVNARMG